jgi:hypothetical protein
MDGFVENLRFLCIRLQVRLSANTLEIAHQLAWTTGQTRWNESYDTTISRTQRDLLIRDSFLKIHEAVIYGEELMAVVLGRRHQQTTMHYVSILGRLAGRVLHGLLFRIIHTTRTCNPRIDFSKNMCPCRMERTGGFPRPSRPEASGAIVAHG